jgi:hypothetical protein
MMRQTAPSILLESMREEDAGGREAGAHFRKILFRNGNLNLALAGWWCLLWARSGCGGSGWAPGWCGWAVASLLLRCCGGGVCCRPAISLPSQSVAVGEVGRCVGVRWRSVGGVGVLQTGPVAARVRVHSSVSHL